MNPHGFDFWRTPMTLPQISRPQNGPHNQPSSSSQNPTQVPNSSEDPHHPTRICGEPRAVAVHDEVLQLCYYVTVPCGGTAERAAERYRRYLQTRALSDNVASRLHRQPAAPAQAPAENPSEDGVGTVMQGVLEFLLALTPLGWSGCSSAQPDVPIEIPDASNPPPNEDPVCGSRRSYIQDNDPLRGARAPGADGGVSVLSELQRQYPG